METDVIYKDIFKAPPRSSTKRDISNVVGDVVMFYGDVDHESVHVTKDMHEHLIKSGPTDCRMTQAFDIFAHPTAGHHAVPLYDPEDPWWEKDPQASLGDA